MLVHRYAPGSAIISRLLMSCKQRLKNPDAVTCRDVGELLRMKLMIVSHIGFAVQSAASMKSKFVTRSRVQRTSIYWWRHDGRKQYNLLFGVIVQ